MPTNYQLLNNPNKTCFQTQSRNRIFTKHTPMSCIVVRNPINKIRSRLFYTKTPITEDLYEGSQKITVIIITTYSGNFIAQKQTRLTKKSSKILKKIMKKKCTHFHQSNHITLRIVPLNQNQSSTYKIF